MTERQFLNRALICFSLTAIMAVYSLLFGNSLTVNRLAGFCHGAVFGGSIAVVIGIAGYLDRGKQ